MRVMLASEMAHSSALRGFQNAMRAGDLERAGQWLRLAERHYRLVEAARRDADRWKTFKRRCAESDGEERRRVEENRKFARQLRAAEHQRRLKAIEDDAIRDRLPAGADGSACTDRTGGNTDAGWMPAAPTDCE